MHFVTLLITAIGLSMDAFAVAMCKGLSLRRYRARYALIVGLYFGFFQGAMPLIGYFLGINLAHIIEAYDHWIAFVLLAFLGGKMLYEAFSADEDETCDAMDFKTMLVLSVATSIDALAVGITLAFLKVNIVTSVLFIGVITFTLSAIGVKIGNVFGAKYKSTAELTGGVVLILMGTKILLEHLGIINF